MPSNKIMFYWLLFKEMYLYCTTEKPTYSLIIIINFMALTPHLVQLYLNSDLNKLCVLFLATSFHPVIPVSELDFKLG